jgi:hypothetical protein
MQPLFATKTAGALWRAGYADDGKLAAWSRCLQSNSKILEDELSDVAHRCADNKVPLDYEKSGLLHFTKSTKQGNPDVALPTTAPQQVLKAT